MSVKRITKRAKVSVSSGGRLAVGTVSALILTFILAILLTTAVANEKVSPDRNKLFSKGIWMVSSAVGCAIGVGSADDKKIAKAAVVTAAYLLVLVLISISVFHGDVSGLGWGILFSLIGCIGVSFTKVRGKKKKWK